MSFLYVYIYIYIYISTLQSCHIISSCFSDGEEEGNVAGGELFDMTGRLAVVKYLALVVVDKLD